MLESTEIRPEEPHLAALEQCGFYASLVTDKELKEPSTLVEDWLISTEDASIYSLGLAS